MEMVAASKLKRYQKLHEQTVPYVQAIEGVLKRLLATDVPLEHPLLEVREEKKTALLVITSDTGLCGSYNHGLAGEAKKFLSPGSKPSLLIGVGKNGVNALSREGHVWHKTFTNITTAQMESVIAETSSLIETLFMKKQIDSVYAVYSHLTSRSVYRATTEKILPFTLTSSQLTAEEDKGEGVNYILEPSREALFTRLVPLVFAVKMRMIFLESFISEHTARMNAMHQATENATELIDALVLLRNKIRQAAITKELIEIVSGSKALKN